MDVDESSKRPLDRLERQAHAWLVRLTSGAATTADAERFRRWCARSPAHRQAFARARRQWQRVGDAANRIQAQPLQLTARDQRHRWSRRAFLGAAVAAPATLAVVAAVHPPLGLWPSVSALTSDFHTATGERLRIVPGAQLNIQLDTQTSLRRRSDRRGPAFELVQGQAAVQAGADVRLALYAGAGCIVVDEDGATLDVRNTNGKVRVACLAGNIRIEHPEGRLQLQAGQQARYDDRISGVVTRADPTDFSAWTEGMLVFRRAPLSEVVDEINRYRRGRVMLGRTASVDEPVSGRFRIDDPEAALEQLGQGLSLQLRRYPGGIAVIG